MELHLVADTNLSNFANILKSRAPGTDVRTAPLDQVVPYLRAPHAEEAAAWVWTRPERISPAFQRSLSYEVVDDAEVLADVDLFADLLIQAATHWRTLYVPLWQVPTHERSGRRELQFGTGTFALLLRMNHRLMERVAGSSNIQLMNSQRWLQAAGTNAWSERLWYMTKTPFGPEVYRAAADDLVASLELEQGHGIKLIVTDLDDTLWGGIVGDDGWEDLRIGGHDPVGEACQDLQRSLKALQQRGILLAIASKNDRDTALEAMDKHPEMVLRRDDFVAMRIDWNDKAGNIASMLQELNLGARHVLFLDDNPVERSRVREFLPEVLVPEWPPNKLLYARTLRSLPVFELQARSQEDAQRTRLYHQEAERERSREGFDQVDQWLRSLGMKVSATPVGDTDLARVHQLLNKTNQFNLATRRPDEKELRERLNDPAQRLWSIRVSDRYGDAGLTGVLGLDLHDPEQAVVTDLVLSCRVMGRGVEETLLHLAWWLAHAEGRTRLSAQLLPTAKNKPCLTFLERSGLTRQGDHLFLWDVQQPYPLPATLELERPDITPSA